MIDLSPVLECYAAARRAGETGTLVTLVDVEGSTYMRPGARAFIDVRGDVTGLVSGGCLEKDLAEHARALSASHSNDSNRPNRPNRLVIYDLRDEADIDFGLGIGCKGKLTILLEWIDPTDMSNPLQRLEAFWYAHPSSAATWAVALDGDPPGARFWHDTELGQAIGSNVANTHRSRIETLDGRRFFVEYLPPRSTLAVFGAGPDAIPVVHRARALGWRVALWDHRESAVAHPGFALCDERHVVPVVELARAAAEVRASAALVMTHNYRADLEILRGLSAVTHLRYVGLLGPRDRADSLREELGDRRVEHLYSPAGLDVGAETPEAIALAIVAEIHAVLRDRAGGSLCHRGGPIHDRER